MCTLVNVEKVVSSIGQKVRRMIVKRYRSFMKQLLDLFSVGKRTFQV